MARTLVPKPSVQGTPFEDRPPQGSINYDGFGNPQPLNNEAQKAILACLQELVLHARHLTSENFGD